MELPKHMKTTLLKAMLTFVRPSKVTEQYHSIARGQTSLFKPVNNSTADTMISQLPIF